MRLTAMTSRSNVVSELGACVWRVGRSSEHSQEWLCYDGAIFWRRM
jgi:hypothetical protein